MKAAAWALWGLLASSQVQAEEELWRGKLEADLHATLSAAHLAADSRLNPGNQLARLDRSSQDGEARINLQLESERLQFSARPILSHTHGDTTSESTAYLSQGRVQARLTQSLALGLGREILHWGPGQFRSPASPFYFDNGRATPNRELSGVDAVKLSLTPEVDRSFTLAYVADAGHAGSTRWRQTWLARAEVRAEEWTAAAVLAQARGLSPLVGVHGQWTRDDGWLLYGEAASATRAAALESPADPAQPFAVLAESPRRLTALLGASYTFPDGRSLGLEWLHDGHGYRRQEAAAWFARAAASPTDAALALGYKPSLLGRRYLHLVWQNSPLDDQGYWRVMASRNLEDGGNEFAVYLDHPLNPRWSWHALAVLNTGGAGREFGALIERSLLAGLRLALP